MRTTEMGGLWDRGYRFELHGGMTSSDPAPMKVVDIEVVNLLRPELIPCSITPENSIDDA